MVFLKQTVKYELLGPYYSSYNLSYNQFNIVILEEVNIFGIDF